MGKILGRYKQEFYIIFLSFILLVISVPVLTYFYFARDLTSKESIMNRNNTGVTLLDRNMQPFFTFYSAKYKTTIPITEVPEVMQHAIISAEDRDFYTHPGFSLKAILRSLVVDVSRREVAYGGSTITQQLVKNVLLNANKSFLRKYQEIVLAQEIERRYSKQEILEMYLNSVYFGEGAFGVEDAALTYFGKHASELNLQEASLLAGILPSPSRYSPLSGGLNLAKVRQNYVLTTMEDEKYISEAQAKAAYNAALDFKSDKESINVQAPHFALFVRDALIKQFGEERISRSGFEVQTTIDLDKQAYAEQVVENQVNRLAGNLVTNGAAVVLDPKTGEILAMVGSKDWYNEKFGKVNIITSKRQPGSSFKPIVYSDALERHLITPATLLKDEPTTFPGNYKPLDYDKRFRGKVTVRRALSNSLNIPAVEVQQKVGVEEALDQAEAMGITTLLDPSNYGLSLVLGTATVKPLEMTSAYAIFADGGNKHSVSGILSIKDKSGKDIYTYKPTTEEVLDAGVAFQISSILSDNIARAEEFGNALTISRPAAVKTGTTENYRDAWTLGYTPSLVVGVWVGNNDNSPMDQIAGSLGAAPIWRSLMEEFLAGTPVERFTAPSDIHRVPICRSNGYSLRNVAATSSAMMEYFLSGTGPTRSCDGSSGNPTPNVTVVSGTPTESPSPTEEPKEQPTPTPTTIEITIPTIEVQGAGESKDKKNKE